MKSYTPTISVVLNVFNESKNIEKCLGIIRSQDYPQNKIDIVIVDDKSTDNTVELAKKYDVKIVTSGYHNRERAKGIGLENATGELVLLMDCDVFLQGKDWISKAVRYLGENPKAVGVQNIRWFYKEDDYLANRYCNLFCLNDPFVEFLGKRGTLKYTEKEWMYPETVVKKTKDYYLVKFQSDNLPTLGAQGYIVRREIIQKASYTPYFFHLDNAMELVQKGYNQFILAELPVEHAYVKSVKQFYKKLHRNITLYLELLDKRTYKYPVSRWKFLKALFLMLTIIYPLTQSLKGYTKKPDPAWLLHPPFCFTIPLLYAYVVSKSKLKHLLLKS